MATTSGALLSDGYQVPDEERVLTARKPETYEALVRRLSHQSVVKHFDAYGDVPWDDPDFRIDPDDPRWELGPDDTLGGTAWYRAQPAGVRSRIGLHMYGGHGRSLPGPRGGFAQGLVEPLQERQARCHQVVPGGLPGLR